MAHFRLVILMLSIGAMAMVARSTDTEAVLADSPGQLVGDSLEVAEEEMMMESESARRQLKGRSDSYISYGALKPSNAPCNKRGLSYYSNCREHQKANPYNRSCTKATKCQRNNR